LLLLLVDKSKFEKIKKIISPKINYTIIKFKSDFYKIGDDLLIKDCKDDLLVAKLTKIIQFNGFKKYPFWPTIEIQW